MNYYNENDPKCAAWLRELIKAGCISDGVIDERSILDVDPKELSEYAQCHFFAGIGGWSYALRLAGWPDDKPAWTGSCPCQPFSQAGKGKVDKDERHLWPAFREAIAIGKPSICFGEQVASKDGRIWLAGVRTELEALGYGFGASDLCAAGVGAPHPRQRLYWVAHANIRGCDSRRGEQSEKPEPEGGNRQFEQRSSVGGLADMHQPGLQIGKENGKHSNQISTVESCRNADRLADSKSIGSGAQWKENEFRRTSSSGSCSGMGESNGSGRDAGKQTVQTAGHGSSTESTSGACGLAITGSQSAGRLLQRSRKSNGKIAQRTPNQSGGSSSDRATAWSNFAIIPMQDGKSRRIESGTFPLAHGVPGRVGLLRGYGNAIVPQVAAEFIQAAIEAIT